MRDQCSRHNLVSHAQLARPGCHHSISSMPHWLECLDVLGSADAHASAAVLCDMHRWQCQQVAAAPFTEAPSTCPPAPSPSSGACPTDTTPATASLSTASLNLTYTQCLPAASVQYDAFTRRFAFSALLSLACLPSAFRNVPFTLSVLGITRGVSDMPPGAAAALSIEALKPATVGISLFLTPPATATTTTTSALGPWSSDQASMTLPPGGVASIGIRITVPADQQLLDGAAVGAEIQVLAPTPSPAPSPSPGASSSGSAAAALTPGSPVLAATFVVLRDISHSADLQLNAVQRSQADGSVYTRSMGYVMLVGLAFKASAGGLNLGLMGLFSR